MFVPGKPFQPIIIILCRAGALPKCSLPWLSYRFTRSLESVDKEKRSSLMASLLVTEKSFFFSLIPGHRRGGLLRTSRRRRPAVGVSKLSYLRRRRWNRMNKCICPGNTNVGSIAVPLTSCLTGLDSTV